MKVDSKYLTDRLLRWTLHPVNEKSTDSEDLGTFTKQFMSDSYFSHPLLSAGMTFDNQLLFKTNIYHFGSFFLHFPYAAPPVEIRDLKQHDAVKRRGKSVAKLPLK